MFYAVNKITATDGEKIAAYQLFQIAKKLTSGQLLYLKASHDIRKSRTPGHRLRHDASRPRLARSKSNGPFCTESLPYPDEGNSRVQEFNSSGTFINAVGAGYNGVTGSIGSSGAGNGQLNNPLGFAIDASGNVWVSDNENSRVEEFNSSGTYYVSKFSDGYGSANGHTNNPGGIAIDASGNIWLSDAGNYRVEEFNSSGTFLQSIGGPSPHTCETSPAGSPPACASGTGSGQFSNPNGIAIGR